jgi:hypothetical protein
MYSEGDKKRIREAIAEYLENLERKDVCFSCGIDCAGSSVYVDFQFLGQYKTSVCWECANVYNEQRKMFTFVANAMIHTMIGASDMWEKRIFGSKPSMKGADNVRKEAP